MRRYLLPWLFSFFLSSLSFRFMSLPYSFASSFCCSFLHAQGQSTPAMASLSLDKSCPVLSHLPVIFPSFSPVSQKRKIGAVVTCPSCSPVTSQISRSFRLRSRRRPRWTSKSIAEASWPRIAGRGRSIPISIMVSRRASMSWALFAWPVLRDPSCPGFAT